MTVETPLLWDKNIITHIINMYGTMNQLGKAHSGGNTQTMIPHDVFSVEMADSLLVDLFYGKLNLLHDVMCEECIKSQSMKGQCVYLHVHLL